MCGIFGLIAATGSKLSSQSIEEALEAAFKLSENRGSEASGIAIAGHDRIEVFKRAQAASRMIKSPAYLQYLHGNLSAENRHTGLCLIGHSRLVTNGSQGLEENNQPVASDHCVGVHNGIVVNDQELWARHADLSRKYQVDTEVLYRLIDKYSVEEGVGLIGALVKTYKEILGEANIAFVHTAERVLGLASNVGSIFYARLPNLGAFIFASERFFLEQLLRTPALSLEKTATIAQLKPNNGLTVNISDLHLTEFRLDGVVPVATVSAPVAALKISDRSPKRAPLTRCTKCVLPHTFPFIKFDANGVCNFCAEGQPAKVDDLSSLEARLARYRSKDGSPDCIVALSGGRDSCYGLHVIKKELGLNPIAYTYDWAMVTDEARRNCARICSELGVEHIIRSADILSKRRNIRLNIEAWLKRPELGMIPLFMAGDKQFFHYATQVSRQTNVPLVIFCGGNNLEVTRFKTGFCGVKDKSTNTMVGLDTTGKFKLLAYYAKNFLLNPAYLNRSVWDTLFAFYSTYVSRQDFLYLYRYVDWDEKVIAETLEKYYGWESSSDSASTWRIGDGTAAYYNYIYHTVAGFSEHDTFRSNQIRAGLLDRQKALDMLELENKPRYAAMQEYASLVGFSLDEALVTINNIPKLK